jgi:hypothetical protein
MIEKISRVENNLLFYPLRAQFIYMCKIDHQIVFFFLQRSKLTDTIMSTVAENK